MHMQPKLSAGPRRYQPTLAWPAKTHDGTEAGVQQRKRLSDRSNRVPATKARLGGVSTVASAADHLRAADLGILRRNGSACRAADALLAYPAPARGSRYLLNR
jgi:hypothetical protein